jgi:ATP-dependent Clp protease, protease subunit
VRQDVDDPAEGIAHEEASDSMIAMVGDEVVMPQNAMLMLHDPSGLVMGTASDMRAMAEALDRMKAGMVATYREKSGRDDAEIEALMAAETWISAQEAVALGLADRVELPVRMAAHFDLSRFRNTPPQLAALVATPSPQEDVMPDPEKKRTSRAAPAADVEQRPDAQAESAPGGTLPSQSEPGPEGTDEVPSPDHQPAADPGAPAAAAQPSAQVIDLDAVRADERKATLAYVAEVHELCALAGRGDLTAGFIAKATPVAQVRRALLEARAAEDEATTIRSQVRPAAVEPAQPAIDTAAIYAARNQNVR